VQGGSFFKKKSGAGEKEYLYNGKELQEETGVYDFGWRQYDPVIGRMTTIDPLATNHFNLTPYNYVMNNPVLYRDEFGLDTGKVKPAPKPIVLKEVKVTATKAKKKSDVDPVGTNLFHHTYKPAPWNHDDCHCPVLDQVMILATIFVTDGFGEFLEGGAAAESDEIIQFGQNENQISHALRHLEEEGLSPEEITDVKSAIKNDLSKTGGEVKAGAPVTPRTITVNGVKIQYNAFRLNNSVINVGRITILK
jgi:RHS repeat-associated protein